MSRTDKILKDHDNRLKVLEENAGLLNDGAANVKTLLDTIRVQGIVERELRDQITYLNEALQLRNEFLTTDSGRQKNWENFLKKKDQERKAAPLTEHKTPALELKESTPVPDEKICAPSMITPQWTACGKLRTESRMVQNGEFVTCKDCIKDLEESSKKPKIVEMPPPEPVAAKEPEQPQDAGGKIDRKIPEKKE